MFKTGFKIVMFDASKIRLMLSCYFFCLPFLLLISYVFSDFSQIALIASVIISVSFLVSDIYAFIKTNKKLESSHLIMGIQGLVLAAILFVFFVIDMKFIFVYVIIYLVLIFILVKSIFKNRLFSYNSDSEKNSSYVWSGYAIGVIIARNLTLGESYKYIFIKSVCLVFSLLLMFLSIQMICKFVYITKYKNSSRFYYDYESK